MAEEPRCSGPRAASSSGLLKPVRCEWARMFPVFEGRSPGRLADALFCSRTHQSSFTGRKRRHSRYSRARGQTHILAPREGSFNLFTERSRRGHLHKLALTFWSHNRQNTPAMTSLCPTSLRAGRGVGYREFRSEFRLVRAHNAYTLLLKSHHVVRGKPRAVVYVGKCICSTMG